MAINSPGPSLAVHPMSFDQVDELDLLVFAIGYETRSSFVWGKLAGRYSRALGIRFGVHEVKCFDENLARAEDDALVDIEYARTELDFRLVLHRCLAQAFAAAGRPLRVGVDVSSFPRLHLAALVTAARDFGRTHRALVVDFLYAPAEFSPPKPVQGPVVQFGAIGSEFSAISDPNLPLGVVVGLGYEPDLALAVQQVLDPATTWLTVPRGDSEFDQAVMRANELILSIVNSSNIWPYTVMNPFTSFVDLESIVGGLVLDHNVVLVPLGPKVLVVLSLLVAVLHSERASVWRLNSGALHEPQDQLADGRVSALRAVFSA